MNKISKWFKIQFAAYVVICDYGTIQYCWTLRGAHSWIGYCGTVAQVVKRNQYDYDIIAERRIG